MLSYRQGLEWALTQDERPRVLFYGANRTMMDNARILPDSLRRRVLFATTPQEADYILDNYTANDGKPLHPEAQLLHNLTIDGLPIIGIFRGL